MLQANFVKLGSEQFSHLGRVRKGMSIKNLPDFTILGSLQLAYPYHMLYNVRDKMILKYIPKPDKIAFSEVIGSKPSSGFLVFVDYLDKYLTNYRSAKFFFWYSQSMYLVI
uniref:Uncharacterized protein n=1 Tax=Cacopsylla melanoneura TaxID=428564 RepID=A0A8D8RUC8_9HEMI